MLKQFIKTYFKELLIVGIVIYASSKLKGILNTDDKEELPQEDKLPVRTADVVLSTTEIKTVVANLYKSLVAYPWGTHEELFYKQFDKITNQDTFNAVFNAFGKVQYSYTWGNQGDPITSPKANLIEIISNELNEDEMQYFREHFPQLTLF